jgi:hypothetical protein
MLQNLFQILAIENPQKRLMHMDFVDKLNSPILCH